MMSRGGEVNDWMAERNTETQQLEKRYKRKYEEIARKINKQPGGLFKIACVHFVQHVHHKNMLTHNINNAQVHTCPINTNICCVSHLLDGGEAGEQGSKAILTCETI